MATAARQPKPNRRGGAPAEPARRIPAWTGTRQSPTFSPPPSSTPRPANAPASQSQNSFPPLGQANGAKPDTPDRVLRSLSGLTGTTITLLTKTKLHYEGVVSSTNNEGDTTGVTLKDVKEISNPGAPLKDQLFIAATNIETWNSGPADAKLTNGDTFKTDVDISNKAAPRERELQAWVPDGMSTQPQGASIGSGDDATFGPGASHGAGWDQFETNKKMFGVTTSFDEDLYTTKLDRTAADFKEREKKAQALADEIMGATSANPHVAEERNQAVDDSGANEEDKYSTVVRGAGAYVPPGARPKLPASVTKPDAPSVTVSRPNGAAATPTASKSPSPAPANAKASAADPVQAFRGFVTNEKQRLNEKRQVLLRNEMDKKMAELVAFSNSFKLNKPIPDDLVPILAKDEEKQKQIREKATKDSTSSQARTIGPQSTAGASGASNAKAAQALAKAQAAAAAGVKPSPPGAGSPIAKPSSGANTPAGAAAKATPTKTKMFIQAIPPFKPKNGTATPAKPAAPNGTAAAGAKPPAGATPAQQQSWNANAPTFRPNPKANAFTPGAPSSSPNPNSNSNSPKPKDTGPNPFFGTRAIKKTPLVNVKDDFNPFKHAKVADASAITANWPYTGKRYAQAYPPPQHTPQQHVPQHPPPMPPPPMAPADPSQYPQGDPNDPNSQAAPRPPQYVFYAAPYGYPPQMMPGMPPGPPGTFMAPPPHGYMQMPYPPPGMPPNMYPPPGMQMPPPGYMPGPPPPPGSYPAPPNGAGPRPSMPPTPIPSHAHPYYPSPQLPHAVPYGMMMGPPPNAVPQHPGYEGAPPPQAPPPMGNHA